MNVNISPNIRSLNEIVENTKNSNSEVRVDRSGNLNVRESKGNFLKHFGNKNARAEHREAAISIIKNTIQQEYKLSNDDINGLMGGAKKKITVSDLKDLINKCNQIHVTTATNTKNDVFLESNNKKNETPGLIDLTSHDIDVVKENRAIREAEIKSIKQEYSKVNAVSGLLKAASISVPHLATTTYSELKKESKDKDLDIGKMISNIPKKMAKSEGKIWSQLTKPEKDFYIDQVKNKPLDSDFIDKLATKLLANEKFYDGVKASGNSGLLDAQVWNQETLTEGKLIHQNGICYGLVTSWALDIAQDKFSSSSDFINTLNNDNYENLQDLHKSQFGNEKYGSINETIMVKRDKVEGIKLESGFNEITLRTESGSGHAVAVYVQANLVTFFDPNLGMFEFDNIENTDKFINNIFNACYSGMPRQETIHYNA